MSGIEIAETEIPEGVDGLYLARVEKPDGTYVVQSDVASVDVRVFTRGADDSLLKIYETIGLANTATFQTVITKDGNWTKDEIGYTFRYAGLTQVELATQSAAYEGGQVYGVEFIVHTNANGQIPVLFRDVCIPISSL